MVRTEDRTPPDLENGDLSLNTGFLTVARLSATSYSVEEIRKKSPTLIRQLHKSRKSSVSCRVLKERLPHSRR